MTVSYLCIGASCSFRVPAGLCKIMASHVKVSVFSQGFREQVLSSPTHTYFSCVMYQTITRQICRCTEAITT